MNNDKTCGECKHFQVDAIAATCEKKLWICDDDAPACKKFEPAAPPTNGDKIRQGGNRELKDIIFGNRCYYCAFKTENDCCSRPKSKDCPDGIEAWLNAPAGEHQEIEE